ncbi:MAG TPA: cation-translocating P-type ATPase [Aggregatilineales bacterium]|nr:cation-translocating P-type ATPase [Aggregatilineales bacterium]
MNQTTYRIHGMDCADCALKIEKGVGKLEGVRAACVDFATSRLTVDGDVSAEAVEGRVQALGYSVINESGPVGAKHSGVIGFWDYLVSRPETRFPIAGGALILLALAASALGLADLPRTLLLVLAMIVAGYPTARKGIVTLIVNRDFSIDLLMTIAAVGAVLIGETLEAATVIFLFAIGEALEGYTADRARDSLRGLMALAPLTAIKLDGESERIVGVDSLQVGDTILVKPGERIAMDGIILTGESAVNQAPITGESVPVYKAPGAEVYAGTINGEGMLRVTVSRLAADNTLSRIVHLVEEAQSVRAPSQRTIDRFARLYTPAIVLIAMLIATIPPLLFHAPLLDGPEIGHGWLYRALSLLVIACPCALVISAPVTVISGITAAARRGVLIRGGAHLEALAQVRAFALDKTGTLTHGEPVVQQARSIDCKTGVPCADCDDVLALASAVEQRSTHPLAKAVVSAAGARGLIGAYPPAESVEALAGRGVRGKVGERLVTLGSHSLFDAEHPHSSEFCDMVSSAETNGETAMLLCNGDRVQGFISLSDAVREDSKAAIADLKKLDETTVMLTGDNASAAALVGRELGIDAIRAGLLPADKVAVLRDLMATYKQVAMVGDGINDTPALAAATVGIAMGGAGSAQALETADIALMADDLTQLPFAVRLARFTRSLILQNVWISLGMKVVFLLLALIGGVSLWLAILADVGVSLLVTLNGMRPLRYGQSS